MGKSTKIEREKRIVQYMISFYCRDKHNSDENLCEHCVELLQYAHTRLDRCVDGNSKLSCKRCPHHCYKPEMAAKIRTVMRYSGPRIFFRSPIESLKHL